MHEEAIRKADVLIEALGFIRQFHGRFTVIKLGGSVMEDPETLRALLVDVVFMQTVGMRPVVVHGGGKAITVAMEKAGLTPRFVQGRRYTDEATLEIVARVLAEEINADIERHINKFGGRASGLHHKTTLQCLYGRRLELPDGHGGSIDLGLVGEVTEVDVPPIENHCLAGVVPVLPSLAEDEDHEGQLLNVNADTAAAAVAQAIQAEKLVFLTDTPGILLDKDEPDSLIPGLTPEECRDLIERGVIDRGMIPKVEACLTSLEAGVKKTHIIDGRLPHALLLEIFTQSGIGTEIARQDIPHDLRRARADAPCWRASVKRSLTLPENANASHRGDDRAVRAIRDCQLPAIPRLPGPGRRVVDLGRRGEPLPRLLSGLGLQPPGPLPAAGRRGGARAGRPVDPRAQHLVHGASGRAGRGPVASGRSAARASSATAGPRPTRPPSSWPGRSGTIADGSRSSRWKGASTAGPTRR